MVFQNYSGLYRNIVKDLLQPEVLSHLGLEKGLVQEYLLAGSFKEKVQAMVADNNYSSQAVLDLALPFLQKLAGDLGEECFSPSLEAHWLRTVYHYALGKSFPEAVEMQVPDELALPCQVYLRLLRTVADWQKDSRDGTWQSIFPLKFLTPREEEELENPREYRRLKKAFAQEYLYEMMKLNQEVIGYDTLDHICGVHFLALFLGRQLKRAGIPVDLGRVSGAAMGHDLGKYGCKSYEAQRVPYLHYYYTDQWFQKHDITYIRNIAINHSVWDLELENLSLEALLLIYSDFRVKKKQLLTNKSRMYIYSLAEAFSVILNKLDNVDQKKERRYQRVYNKLRDFEDYMEQLGINVDLSRRDCRAQPLPQKYYALNQGEEIISNCKNLSIHHNIHLMHKLRDEFSLNAILESARGEVDLNNLRQYIGALAEYSTYLTQKQKLTTIRFLYDQLVHPEDDIRRECGGLIGVMIATFDEDYRKAVPDNVQLEVFEITSRELLTQYLEHFLYPDDQILPVHRQWISDSLSYMLTALFKNCRKDQVEEFLGILLRYYQGREVLSNNLKLLLMNILQHLPLEGAPQKVREGFRSFAQEMLVDPEADVRLLALETMANLAARHPWDQGLLDSCQDLFAQPTRRPLEDFLRYQLARELGFSQEMTAKYKQAYAQAARGISGVFLSNLKTATNWVIKKIQVDLLHQYALQDLERNGLYTAIHFCNLLKVSENAHVRNQAGEALLEIVPRLPLEQRNDVVVELLRAMEIEGYQFAKYVPDYLGQLILRLEPGQLDEVIEDLEKKIKRSGSHVNLLLLQTIGISLENYYSFHNVLEDEGEYKDRMNKMLGILLNGLVHDNHQVKQVAISVLGKSVFGSPKLTLEEKLELFQLVAKKILVLVGDEKDEGDLTFFANASGLNHIYRFVADYIFYRGDMGFRVAEKVAFFAGAFDPFSLSHKEIAREIRAMGFEVFLAVDEFSWSKLTQPNLIRRKIINMSIADELDIYLFPDDIQINLANLRDLKTLKRVFPHSEVHIVVGSDVLAKASAYKAVGGKDSIYSFPHIIFERRSDPGATYDAREVSAALEKMEKPAVTLSLPPQYEDISSSQIRTYIDEKRDISQLIDPLAQKYIYDNNLYQREPQYKLLLQAKALQVEVREDLSENFLRELASLPFIKSERAYEALVKFSRKLSPRVLLIRSRGEGGRILGFSAFHWIRSSMFLSEFQYQSISEYIRNHGLGRVIVFDGFFAGPHPEYGEIEQMLLTETITYCLGKDYSYGIFKNMMEEDLSASLVELLGNHGFQKIPQEHYPQPLLVVNMTNPCSLYLDVETVIKEPFKNSKWVKRAIQRSRSRLQRALTGLFPGHLVLSFDRTMLYENLIKKICEENGVPPVPANQKILGDNMCVPFGAILKGCILPNTVTKSLHAERFFQSDMRRYEIRAYPDYLELRNQVRMIRSFNRPVILVDDILHKGYRLKGLDPLIKKENVQVKKIIVGILSGRGKELMDLQNREVDGAYFVPKLRVWFNESLLYPFMGGDTLWRGSILKGSLVPSVNQILPFTSPNFIRGATKDAIYHLSETCLENALDIVTTLEEEYQRVQERGFTLAHLGEVFLSARYPDQGRDVVYDLNAPPSLYLENHLEHLQRLRGAICEAGSNFRGLSEPLP